MENTLEAIQIINEDVKITKQPKIRSEKQKENDVKLKERLTEYHLKKKEAKKELLKMKEITDAFKEIESDTENILKLEEQEINQLIEINNIEQIECIEIKKTKKGRPKKIKQEYPDSSFVCSNI